MSKKQKLLDEIEYIKRTHFLEKYHEFDRWLYSIKFRKNHFWKEQAPHHYSQYDELIESMYSCERYINDILELNIYFIRDKNKHIFLNLEDMKLYSLEDFKMLILFNSRKIKEEKILKIMSLTL